MDSFRPSPFLETGDDERDFMTAVYFLSFLLYESTMFGMSQLLEAFGASSALLQPNIQSHVYLIFQYVLCPSTGLRGIRTKQSLTCKEHTYTHAAGCVQVYSPADLKPGSKSKSKPQKTYLGHLNISTLSAQKQDRDKTPYLEICIMNF